MNEHDDEIGTGGRVDPEDITDTEDVQILTGDEIGHIDKDEKWFATGRNAMRAYRFGVRQDKPARSRCQRKTPKQRLNGPTGKALQRKQKRRDARVVAWLAAEREWNNQQDAA